MYINQIDQIIDQILDNFYLDVLDSSDISNLIINGKNNNFVEYRDRLNKIIQDFVLQIDIEPIRNLINNKENIQQIIDIVRRYVAYYLFMYIIFYYKGTQKMYIDNIIQYSKFQEMSNFHIKNFFNSENNYQLINFFKMIKDISKLLFMTDMQKKNIDVDNYKSAINFLNDLGSDYIDNFLLLYSETNGNPTVNINVHNLIKTIVFRELYIKQEKSVIFRILNEIEENETEYRYIDVVIADEEFIDFNTFKQILGYNDTLSNEVFAHDFYKMLNQSNAIEIGLSLDKKNTLLLQFPFITPIVDDFLRYHKDSERIDISNDKNFVLPISLPSNHSNPNANTNNRNTQLAMIYQQRKKKENTRIQLVINKIDNVIEYYSTRNVEFQKEIRKYFYQPLIQRKAILYNDIEEINIMKKIMNQGRRVMENNEYFLELRHYNSFPYINFKDFLKYGTVVEVDKTIEVMRYSNIEYQNISNLSDVELHSVGVEMPIHLVGLTINPFNGLAINCISKDKLIDIRQIEINYPLSDGNVKKVSDKNGYTMFLKIIKHFVIDPMIVVSRKKVGVSLDKNKLNKLYSLNKNIWNKTVYWIYDIETDRVQLTHYEDIKATDFQDYVKTLNGEIYDNIMNMLNYKLDTLLVENSHLSQHKIDLFVFMFNRIRGIFGYDKSDEREIIVSYLARKPRYKPINYQYTGEMIPLPVYQIPIRPKIYNIFIDMSDPTRIIDKKIIDIYKSNNQSQYDNVFNTSRCQHEIEWKELNKIKKVFVNKYNENLTKFIQDYAIETDELDFVCKSCGRLLEIRQFVEDGKFNDSQQKFITNYAPMDVPLEDLREYQKYDRTIKIIEKLIDRISLITKVNVFVGNSYANRIRRRHLVKNIIDIIVTHNANLFKQQKSSINNNNIVFAFELDDNIFNFVNNPANPSEIDLNKYKFNNILLYFILEFLPEITDSQILTMSFDRIGNVYNFEKYFDRLFKGIVIRKNINTSDTEYISNYPVLCYLLYLFSYFIIKYNIWYVSMTNTKVFNPAVQKTIIVSAVDLLNSILEQVAKFPNNIFYQIFAIQFYNQNNHLFKRHAIIHALRKFHAKYGNIKAKAVIINEEITDIKIGTLNVIQFPLVKIKTFKMNGLMFLFNNPNDYLYKSQTHATSLTNCITGEFYRFQMNNKELMTKSKSNNPDCVHNLSKILSEPVIDRNKEYYYYVISKIAKFKCLTGCQHDFGNNDANVNVNSNVNLNANVNANVCQICSKDTNHVYTIKELDTLAANLQSIEDERIQETLNKIENYFVEQNEMDDNADKLINELVISFNKSDINNNVQNAINILINTMSMSIGKTINLGLNKYPSYLNDNVYIIDHTYDGSILSNPIIILESDDKILFKENHPFFKTDVYYYTDNRVGQIDVFYHAKTLRLLGYKERQKDYVINRRNNLYLQINYSVKYQLYYMGYESKYIDIKTIFDANKKNYSDDKMNFYHIVDLICREHIKHLKEVTNSIQNFINLVKYSSNINLDPTTVSITPILQIISKYSKLLLGINYGLKDNAFKIWDQIRTYLKYQKIDWSQTNMILDEENYYLKSDTINYYDNVGAIILYYLVKQLNDIILSNPDKTVKNNLVMFLILIINNLYNQYNTDSQKNNLDLKRFDYILQGSSVLRDTLSQGKSVEINTNDDFDTNNGSLDENEAEDARETAQALDIEGRADYEEDYEDEYAEGADDFD
jgi:hypothetical protein